MQPRQTHLLPVTLIELTAVVLGVLNDLRSRARAASATSIPSGGELG